MVEIRQSLIVNAGNGVFATKKYSSGEFICVYDGEERKIQSLEDFIYSVGGVVGFNYVRHENKIGQFINDYCMFDLTDDDRNNEYLFTLSSDKINAKINNKRY